MTSRIRVCIGFLLLYLLLFQVLASWQFTVDDMFISLKYAKNWVELGYLTWHPDLPLVEGYSNFSWVVLAAWLIKLGLNPVFALKLLGVLMLGLSVFTLYHFSRLWLAPVYAFIPGLWLLAYKGEIIWAVSGLETSTYQCLILFSVFSLLRALGYKAVGVSDTMQCNRRTMINLVFALLCGIALSVAGLTRPEAPALMGTLFLVTLGHKKCWQGNVKRFFQAIGIACIPIIVLFIPYFLWRWNYYGHLFPNSVYCKWLHDVTVGELDWEYLRLILPLLALATPYIIKARDYRVVYLLAPSFLYLLLLYNADQVVGFFCRLFLPAFILLLPLPLLGIVTVSKRWLTYSNEKTIVFSASFFIALLLIPGFSLQQYWQFTQNAQAGISLRNELVSWLEKALPSSAEIVLGDCGQVPYLTEFRVIDSYCLNNAAMTSKPINNSYSRFVDWVLTQRKPEAIILMAWHPQGKSVYAPAAKAFLASTRFNSNYRLQRTLKTKNKKDFYAYSIYFRK